jgi:hypothetical protein
MLAVVAAASCTSEPNAPAGTPSGSCARVQRPQPQRTHIRRCSVTSTRKITSET